METQILPTVQKDYRLGPLVTGKRPSARRIGFPQEARCALKAPEKVKTNEEPFTFRDDSTNILASINPLSSAFCKISYASSNRTAVEYPSGLLPGSPLAPILIATLGWEKRHAQAKKAPRGAQTRRLHGGGR